MTGVQLPLDASSEPERREESSLVDCECGCVHRWDVDCPWPSAPESAAVVAADDGRYGP